MGESPKEPLALPAGDNKASVRKQSQVAGDHRGIKPKHSRELAAAALSLSEDRQDPHPRLMGQGLPQSHQILGHLVYCILGHKCKIIRFPLVEQAMRLRNRQDLSPKRRDQPSLAVAGPPILKPTDEGHCRNPCFPKEMGGLARLPSVLVHYPHLKAHTFR